MSVIYFLISISVVVAGIFLYLFIKSVKSGQFDDAYTPSVRMLFDDELKENSLDDSHKAKDEKKLTKVK
ncbi:cbb3-type cytochrome oxidase assembly protein CcoS [Myroides injenensis]|uniref:cbb3-type cytochrome oxidase assembly protein CcoS n=1 Tax=Myroides injenensis TaxID=1183151 RepID=UPI0002887948|nr:cbb3-type cytochrome oxidase assembly protein CcoS [Myroides injenensis]